MDLQPVTLEGRHVRLEPLSKAHVPRLAEIGLDPALWEWTTSRVLSVPEMERYVAEALSDQAHGTALPFALIALAEGYVAGSTRFGNVSPEHRRVEIGWTWVARRWQRTAVNTEAKFLLLRHAFETLACVRVELKTDARNERSRAAIRRLGAVEEGTLRRHMVTSTGRIRDTVYYSILEAEWPDVRRRLEAKIAASPAP